MVATRLSFSNTKMIWSDTVDAVIVQPDPTVLVEKYLSSSAGLCPALSAILPAQPAPVPKMTVWLFWISEDSGSGKS
ncbi:hypothetical protein IMCC3088_2265 [Aequoribacter fuscus]|uniref:Uncharacterized protein n=1 Tax=Aequoribacter fuscus TaxID=2518989 RepID=F3L3S3_9GAMM|nr:hypothetical protein IMCC3088_2265 [Aequoribacter fuscus]